MRDCHIYNYIYDIKSQYQIFLTCYFSQNIAGYEGKIPVAVKTLISRDPELVKKFMEEAELMKKFSHPNIVSLLGISIADSDDEIDEDSAPLMILEYMPYGDLQSFLTTHQ